LEVEGWRGNECIHRVKLTTLTTLLIINNLSHYKSHYIFSKVTTSLALNDLSHYINVIVEYLVLAVIKPMAADKMRAARVPRSREIGG
jgi:hypothetical protein